MQRCMAEVAQASTSTSIILDVLTRLLVSLCPRRLDHSLAQCQSVSAKPRPQRKARQRLGNFGDVERGCRR